MKIVFGVLGAILVSIVLLFGIQYLASERVEVVELETTAETGEAMITRLWIVDFEGGQYLRVGADGSGWYTRIQQNESVQVIRNGLKAEYKVQAEPEKSQVINQLMQDKYTWGDTFIAMLFGREGSIPLRLVAVSGGG